jgi:hypothetical protein
VSAAELFASLEIVRVPITKARKRGPLETCCGPFVGKLIAKHGVGHVSLVLKTITETEGNDGQ